MKKEFQFSGQIFVALICAAYFLFVGNAPAKSLNPPVLRSQQSQFILVEPKELAPSTPLHSLDGETISISDFRGRIVLVNFWASWCAPCIREMPSLEALAASIPSDQFVVVAVALDVGDPRQVRTVVAENHLDHVKVLLDPEHRFGSLISEQASTRTLPVYGLPTSYVLDKAGVVAGFLTGPAQWDSPRARPFIDYFLSLD